MYIYETELQLKAKIQVGKTVIMAGIVAKEVQDTAAAIMSSPTLPKTKERLSATPVTEEELTDTSSVGKTEQPLKVKTSASVKEKNKSGPPNARKRIGKGSNATVKAYRNISFPFMFAYNRLVGLDQVNETSVYARHLPAFFIIPKEREREVMPYTRKHVLRLDDGKLVVAVKDLKNCRDSRNWYARQHAKLDKDLALLKFTDEIIRELDEKSTRQFGRYLLHTWDSGMQKGHEEILFQRKVRGLE